ncbi:long-chain-fatty-acid--CoA ligase 1-like [Artemia franciscana]|uniref:Long-chain-fatty-acid--CoA ligase n=1 Tax=Artemia franciscana TaxID=6661 RepID=A0AA88II70_ARTSF|nr:hypothetical protein QYM36_003543 [Artemia franciscana]
MFLASGNTETMHKVGRYLKSMIIGIIFIALIYLLLEYTGSPVGAIALASMAAAPALYFACRRTPLRPPLDLDKQSEPKGSDEIHYSKLNEDGTDVKFISHLYEDTLTIYDAVRRGAKVSNNGNMLGWRDSRDSPYQWMRYNEALSRAKNFGSGLINLGLRPGSSTLVGMYAQNCPEWVLTEHALYCYSMAIVPLYDTLGPDAVRCIVDQTEMQLAVCEEDSKVKLLLQKPSRYLRKIVCVKEVYPETYKIAADANVEIYRFEQVEKLGAEKMNKEVPPRPDNLCTICYTSGTTGNPKGVMLSHKNVIADVSAVSLQLGDHKPRSSDVMLSFLPLAHMLERTCHVVVYMQGGSIGFYSGDIRNLMEDFKALRPTITPAVPRLLNRIHDKVLSTVNGSLSKKYLFDMALSSKQRDLEKGIISRSTIWDRLVFKKVQESMGGRIRLLVVGSAPLAGNVLTFIRCALGCVIVEGYGQTECVAPATLTTPGDAKPEHVGPPLPCCAIKLVDVPEMEYYTTDGQGEICIKGTNVFMGYYKEPTKTKEVLDDDGWLHTGDVGTWLPNGTLKITDRKKHIFKLSQGEYIAPEKVENIYQSSIYVAQVFVHGESLKSCIVAVVVPDISTVKKWAQEQEIEGTVSDICANPKIKKLILDDIQDIGKSKGLKSFEQAKDIYLHPDLFSIQNGLLTPTLKSKRPQLKQYFKIQIDDMYKNLN